MVDAIVSFVLEQLLSTAVDEAKEQVRLVTGVKKQVKRLQDNFEAIQAVLVDADRRQMTEEPVRLWLEKLKYASYDMEDVLDEWSNARFKLQIKGVDKNSLAPRKKVCSFFPAPSCFGFKQVFLRHDIAQQIKEININLDDIHRQKDMFNFNVIRPTERSERMHSTALINVSDVCGRVEEKKTLKSKLLGESSEQQNAVQTISLVGMGGIGKTTLAQSVYNDNDVINHFGKRIWVCVSDPFDEYRIAKAIIEALEGSPTNLGELNALLQRINESIIAAKEKFLMVLDDVWLEDYNKWESFRCCLMNGQRGSKILVTTRKKIVAGMMESTAVVFIKELSQPECWSLFERIAFFNRPRLEREQLEEIGRKIVDKCKGLPLAAKTIGSLLRFKRTLREWESILDSEMWQLEEFERGLLAPLLLSYNDLTPAAIKQCFLYCAVFPKDYNIKKDELVKLWLAQGYIRPKGNKELEMIGEEYFDYLAARSFFQDFMRDEVEGHVIGCKMHDIVHDFAQYLTKNECFSIEVGGHEESLSLINTSNEKLRHSTLKLGFQTSFPNSLLNAKKLRSLLIDSPSGVLSPVLPRLFDQLTCLRTLQIVAPPKSTRGMIREIPKEIEKLIHLRFLQLFNIQIKELPETCCELINLQTLEIRPFPFLRSLPDGFGKLVNLRHLSEFVVGITCSKNDTRSRGCKLEVLGQLRHLRGSLKIRGLGNVKDVDEAKFAELENKMNLLHLGLCFDKEASQEMNEENGAKHEAIIEALRPPPNLESLAISLYEGKTLFPSWIVSLCKLKKLKLSRCVLVKLPPLGKWPFLEMLSIEFITSVKRVDDEFLGIESGDHLHGIGTTSSVIAFPKLKHLDFWFLKEWEEWDFGKEDNITIMPQLKTLRIKDCEKLKSVPGQLLRSSTTLEELWIGSCPILEERYRKDRGEYWSNISHIPNIRFNQDYVQGGPRSIQ